MKVRAMAAWPEKDERAVLTLACCGEQLTTRIESHDGGQCVVHLPVHTCEQPDRLAEDNVLSWFSAEHCWTRPVEIAGFGGYPRTALWVLQATGETQKWQRRDFVRVTTRLPVAAFAGDTLVAEFEAIDVSEGGLRCAMTTAEFRALPPLFNVRFTVNGTLTRAACRVAWSSVDFGDEEAEAVAGFEFQGLPASECDNIRTYVFHLQIALRRKQLVAH